MAPGRSKRAAATKKIFDKRGRLYAKAIFSGFKRSQRNQYENVALLKIDGASSKEDAQYYLGKRCAYIYKCKNGAVSKHGTKTKMRIMWGRVTRTHGNTGSVRAKFDNNLPATAMSKRIRIMMYPSRVQ